MPHCQYPPYKIARIILICHSFVNKLYTFGADKIKDLYGDRSEFVELIVLRMQFSPHLLH